MRFIAHKGNSGNVCSFPVLFLPPHLQKTLFTLLNVNKGNKSIELNELIQMGGTVLRLVIENTASETQQWQISSCSSGDLTVGRTGHQRQEVTAV